MKKEYTCADWYDLMERRKKLLENRKIVEKIELIDSVSKTKKWRFNKTPPMGYAENHKSSLKSWLK